jgi:hypothetical protein
MYGMKKESRNMSFGKEVVHSSYFFDFHDTDFVEEVYRKILHRQVDPAGLERYTMLLRKGESRYLVLREIYNSNEARNVGVKLEGIGRYGKFSKVKSVPVIGNFLEIISFLSNIKSFRKDLRALENHMYRMSRLKNL